MQKMFNNWEKKYGTKNIGIYFLIIVLTNAWFVEANWLFFWTRFVSFEQMGLMFALITVWEILLEIPSGAVADLIGRKKIIVASLALITTGIGIQAGASSIFSLAIGSLIHGAGVAFFSGSTEALVYDSLKNNHKESDYDKIVGTATQWSIISFVIAVLVGGWLYRIHFRLPTIAFSIMLTIAFILSFSLKEAKYKKKIRLIYGVIFSKLRRELKFCLVID